MHDCPSCKCVDVDVMSLVDIMFEQLWSRYPKKVGKKAALKAWKKVKPTEHKKLFEALARQKSSEQWTANRGKYVPHLSTWLNGERWNDEVEISERTEIIL